MPHVKKKSGLIVAFLYWLLLMVNLSFPALILQCLISELTYNIVDWIEDPDSILLYMCRFVPGYNFGIRSPLHMSCWHIIIAFLSFVRINIEGVILIVWFSSAATYLFYQNPPEIRKEIIARRYRVLERMTNDIEAPKFYVRATSALFLVFMSDLIDDNLPFMYWFVILLYFMAATTININKWDGPDDSEEEFITYRISSPFIFAIMLYIFSITIWILIDSGNLIFLTHLGITFKIWVVYYYLELLWFILQLFT